MKIIFYEFKMDFLRNIRYRMGIISDIAVFTLLLCFFFLSDTGHSLSAQYGSDNYKPLLLLGYIAWSFSVSAISTIGSQILTELQRGTLFFKLNSRLPLQLIYIGDLISAVFIQTFIIVIYTIAASLFFGAGCPVNPTIILALLICLLGMYGIGLMIAGLSLYYKRIGAVILVVQLFLLFVTDTIPTSPVITNISRVIPLTVCNTVIRNSFVGGGIARSMLMLCVSSLIWFAAGYVIFNVFLKRAKKQGNLLFY